VGSLAMILGGFTLALVVLWIFLDAGIFPGQIQAYLTALFVIALASTIVESLPYKDVDNITVTLTALIFGHLLF
jgi:phytol kinase